MDINEFIAKRKEYLGLSDRDIAIKLGMSRSGVTRFRIGDVKKLSHKHILPLAELLKCNPIELLEADLGENEYCNIYKTSTKEFEFIKKYRSCDKRGKEIIDTVLEYEYNRSTDMLVIEENKKLLKIIKVYFELT